MLDLEAYQKLRAEFKELLDKAKEAVAQEKYDLLEQVLFQNEILLQKHHVIITEIDSFIKKNVALTSGEKEAIIEMQTILKNWNDETINATKILETAKTKTHEVLKKIQQGKQIIQTYHYKKKPGSRFIDTQQ